MTPPTQLFRAILHSLSLGRFRGLELSTTCLRAQQCRRRALSCATLTVAPYGKGALRENNAWFLCRISVLSWTRSMAPARNFHEAQGCSCTMAFTTAKRTRADFMGNRCYERADARVLSWTPSMAPARNRHEAKSVSRTMALIIAKSTPTDSAGSLCYAREDNSLFLDSRVVCANDSAVRRPQTVTLACTTVL